jgi:Fe2+ transport system protein FeoA
VETSQWEGPITIEVEGNRMAVPLGLARAISVEVLNG